MEFAAIDFETATGSHDSACAIGIVTFRSGEIVDEYYRLIQPHRNEYWRGNIRVHGIHPQDTHNVPTFPTYLDEILDRLEGKTVVAHNESFDRHVLKKTMNRYGFNYSTFDLEDRWACTCKIYRKLGYKPANLAACCAKNTIQLTHHEALSDARGCGKLYQLALTDRYAR